MLAPAKQRMPPVYPSPEETLQGIAVYVNHMRYRRREEREHLLANEQNVDSAKVKLVEVW